MMRSHPGMVFPFASLAPDWFLSGLLHQSYTSEQTRQLGYKSFHDINIYGIW